LTQIQLAELIGIGQPALVNWEQGRYKPRSITVQARLEHILGAPLHMLLEDESAGPEADAVKESTESLQTEGHNEY
jgi:transcriptional regulator with XRE-family HTH domain